eukprot:1161025-Pelagomonas_calceolata.AAC.13
MRGSEPAAMCNSMAEGMSQVDQHAIHLECFASCQGEEKEDDMKQFNQEEQEVRGGYSFKSCNRLLVLQLTSSSFRGGYDNNLSISQCKSQVTELCAALSCCSGWEGSRTPAFQHLLCSKLTETGRTLKSVTVLVQQNLQRSKLFSATAGSSAWIKGPQL